VGITFHAVVALALGAPEPGAWRGGAGAVETGASGMETGGGRRSREGERGRASAQRKSCAGIPRWVYSVGLLGAKTEIPVKAYNHDTFEVANSSSFPELISVWRES
jgi:hypothetical protein